VLIIFIALGILMISVTTVVLLLIADKRQEKGALPLRPKVGPQEELTVNTYRSSIYLGLSPTVIPQYPMMFCTLCLIMLLESDL
jgi:flagellar basal body-associated protein FliL